MLVLTRKPNQKIRIGDNITISIVRVSGNTIRLGIDAPKDVRIIRSELEQRDKGNSCSQSASDEAVEEPPSASKQPKVSKRPSQRVAMPEEFSRREDDVMCHAPLASFAPQRRQQKFAVIGT